MSLSTSSPSVAAPHQVPVQRGVYYAQHSPVYPQQEMLHASPHQMMARSSKKKMRNFAAAHADMADDNTALEADTVMFSMGGAAPVADMAVSSAEVESAGDLGASYQFQLPHPVNISSTERLLSRKNVVSTTSGPRKLLINTLELKSTIFSYSVPSADGRAYLRAWGDLPQEASVPIIRSDVSSYHSLNGGSASGGARIFIQGTFSGETSVESVQPGGTMHLSLGVDKNIEIKHNPVFSKHSNAEEDKSTWFVTDKVKYRVKTEEFSLLAKSTHAGPILTILAESVPVSTEEDVKVELLLPDPKTITELDDTHSSGDDTTLNAIFAIVGREPPKDMQRENKLHVFFSKKTGHMYWARWLNPSETMTSTLKYKLIWPESKDIVIV